MKSTVMKLSISALLLSLVACVETTSPVCESGNAADLTGVRGDYTFSYSTVPGEPIQSEKIAIERLGRGKYKMSAGGHGSIMNTCRVGRFIVAEAQTSYGTYRQQVFEVGASQTLSTASWMFDAATLSQYGIQSQVVERKIESDHKSLYAMTGSGEKLTEKVLVINNDAAGSNSVLSALGVPNALSLMLK